MPLTNQELTRYYIEQLGWSIFPIGFDKRPLFKWEEYQHKKLTYDEFMDKVRANQGKVGGIAVVTGEISGLAVVDVDFKNGAVDILDGSPTVTSKTGSGGRHYFFAWEKYIQNKVGFLQGIDFRGDGGYIVLPPSNHPSGTKYEWLKSPEDHVILKMPENIAYALENASAMNKPRVDFSATYDVGNRNDTMTSAIGVLLKYLPDQLWSTDAYPLIKAWNFANMNPPLPEQELQASFNQVAKTEIRRRSGMYDGITFKDRLGLSDVDALFEEPQGIKTGLRGFDGTTGGFREGQLAIMAGATGMGKSLFAINLMVKLAQNDIRVCFIDLENGQTLTMKRVLGIHTGMGTRLFNNKANKVKAIDAMKIFNNFDYHSYEFGLKTLGVKDIVEVMAEKVKNGVKVFCIDPLQALEFSLDSGKQLNEEGLLVKTFAEFAVRNRVSIVICHHLRKSQSNGNWVSQTDFGKEDIEPKYRIPTIEDIKGSSKITDFATDVWGFVRSKEGKDARTRSQTRFAVLKCRVALGGNATFYFDENSMRFVDNEMDLTTTEDNLFNKDAIAILNEPLLGTQKGA